MGVHLLNKSTFLRIVGFFFAFFFFPIYSLLLGIGL